MSESTRDAIEAKGCRGSAEEKKEGERGKADSKIGEENNFPSTTFPTDEEDLWREREKQREKKEA